MHDSLDSVISEGRPAMPGGAEEAQEMLWISESRRGDAVAFNRLVLKWERRIFNLALRMLEDRDEAAEAAQEVFLSAYRNIRRFRQDARFSTWLYRIAVNQCISKLRKRPPGVHVSLDSNERDSGIVAQLPPTESHERDFLIEETRARVRKALATLGPEQRAVLELKFYQDLTFEQIAEIIPAPLSTIKSRLYTGLEMLKSRLGSLQAGT